VAVVIPAFRLSEDLGLAKIEAHAGVLGLLVFILDWIHG
jgi:hypothetical protein